MAGRRDRTARHAPAGVQVLLFTEVLIRCHMYIADMCLCKVHTNARNIYRRAWFLRPIGPAAQRLNGSDQSASVVPPPNRPSGSSSAQSAQLLGSSLVHRLRSNRATCQGASGALAVPTSNPPPASAGLSMVAVGGGVLGGLGTMEVLGALLAVPCPVLLVERRSLATKLSSRGRFSTATCASPPQRRKPEMSSCAFAFFAEPALGPVKVVVPLIRSALGPVIRSALGPVKVVVPLIRSAFGRGGPS